MIDIADYKYLPMSTSNLDSLEVGATATIERLDSESGLSQRLYALGFRCGRPIETLRRSWFSGPLHVRIGTTEVMLRRGEAQFVIVTPFVRGVSIT
jgi:ferrous iron transport protein A